MYKTALLLACALIVLLFAAPVWAQTTPPADSLKVDYFSGANTAGAPDGTVRIDNPGIYTNGNVCASIFVFDPYQELSECCSCLITPDGLRTLSIDKDVTDNPLTGVTLETGVVKIVSTIPVKGACPLPTAVNATPALRAWVTHIQATTFAVTETASQDATLSPNEVTRLARECTAVSIVGSGKGVCTCGTGD
jgi:hypothetical protein